jgi:hypothetical protein
MPITAKAEKIDMGYGDGSSAAIGAIIVINLDIDLLNPKAV